MKGWIIKYSKEILAMLSIAGIFLSAYLWYLHWQSSGSIPICLTSGCDDVIGGEYGDMFGIPVAAYGFAFYSLLLLLSLQLWYTRIYSHYRLMWFVLLSGWIFTIYLRYLEFFKIGEICSWCWVSVLIMLLYTTVFYINYKQK